MRNKTNVFTTNLMGVGQQRDFYKVNTLTMDDIKLVKNMFIDEASEITKEFFQPLLNLFAMVEVLESLPEDAESENLKENYATNLEEEFQSEIESQGDKCLTQLLNGDKSFFNTEEGAAHFLNYICMQYLRTKKQQDNLIHGYTGNHKDKIAKCMNLIRVVLSIKLASNMFCNRENYKLVMVDNISEIDFLTSDQPVVNIYAVNVPATKAVEKFALYYPISPKRAIFLAEKEEFNSFEYFQFNEKSVQEYNNMMINEAHEQVYSSTVALLEKHVIK